MVPTFSGRLQTRLIGVVLVGLPWTLLLAPVLAPLVGGIGPMLRISMFTWAATLGLGLVLWEPLYHLLMQFRWEKDWPTLFLLLSSVPEGAVVGRLLATFGPGAPWSVFLLLFASTWLVVLGSLQGPLRVVFLRWRFRGGRFL
jgi:hypothetical protein